MVGVGGWTHKVSGWGGRGASEEKNIKFIQNNQICLFPTVWQPHFLLDRKLSRSVSISYLSNIMQFFQHECIVKLYWRPAPESERNSYLCKHGIYEFAAEQLGAKMICYETNILIIINIFFGWWTFNNLLLIQLVNYKLNKICKDVFYCVNCM